MNLFKPLQTLSRTNARNTNNIYFFMHHFKLDINFELNRGYSLSSYINTLRKENEYTKK